MSKDTTKDKLLFLQEQTKELKREIRSLKKKLKDTQRHSKTLKRVVKIGKQSLNYCVTLVHQLVFLMEIKQNIIVTQ